MVNAQVGKICFARFREDDDLALSIKRAAQQHGVKAGALILIGALKQAVFGCYKNGEYVNVGAKGHLEIASCMGNISVDEKGDIIVHAHIVVANELGQAFGGHVQEGCVVGPTAELTIIEAIGLKLERRYDEKTKLRLLNLT